MGAQQSQTQQTQQQSQSSTLDQSFVTAKQSQQLQQLPASEKKQLTSALKGEQKTAEKEIKKIITKAKEDAKKQKGPEVSFQKELSKKENQQLEGLPPHVHLEAQKKIIEVIKKRDQESKRLVKNEIKKHKKTRHGCTAWAANKRADPSHPKNPETGRALTKNKPTYKLLNKICLKKKQSCAEPSKSPFKGRRTLKEGSRESKLIKGICEKK